MNRVQNIVAVCFLCSAMLCSAGDSTETVKCFWGSNGFSVSATDLTSPKAQSKHPELQQPPAVGENLSIQTYNGTNMVRELKGTVISKTRLDCENGPEIRIETGTVFNFFHALYMTDRLHQSPQVNDVETVTYGDSKSHIEFPPGDYWTIDEKDEFRLKEMKLPIGERP